MDIILAIRSGDNVINRSSFTQTKTWANIHQYCNGIEPIFINHPNLSCLFGLDKKNKSLVSYGGPVVSDRCSADEFNSFLSEVIDLSAMHRARLVAFRTLHPLRFNLIFLEDSLINKKFKKEKWSTFVVNLLPSEELLLKSFQHAARKGIKKGDRLGIQVKRCEKFNDYYGKFLKAYLINQKQELKNKSFYKKYWELDKENIYNYWIAYSEDGDQLGFLGTYSYQGVATEIMSAITPLAFQKKIPVQDIMHWEIMKFHKSKGDLYFDLAGFNPSPTTDKEKNIKRFKEKWGGEVYDCSSFVYEKKSVLYKLMSKIKG